MGNNNEVKYAGFLVRVLAWIIDTLIVGIPMKMLEAILDTDSGITVVLSLIFLWFYYGYTVYRWRATIGKKIVGIEILNYDLTPVSLTKASLRFVYSLITYFLLLSPSIAFSMFVWGDGIFSYIGFLIVLIPILMIFFTQKKQVLHDYFAKTIVVDVSSMLKNTPRGTSIEEVTLKNDVDIEDTKYQENEIKQISIIGFIRTIGIIVVVGFGAYYLYVFGMKAYVFGSLAKHKQRSYDNSFHIKYQTKDYNDTKIIFYKKELELYSKEFIEAEGMYDIFAADTKKDLALGCIQYFIKRKNREEWIDAGSNYRKNARNKYANTEDKIQKAKKKSDYMGRHFYTFDLNMVNHIEDEITQVWSDKNDSICENKLPANELYEIFIEKYIPKFDDENIHSRFGSKPQQREIDWYRILKEKRGDVFQKIQQKKEDIRKEEERAEEKRIALIAQKREQRKRKEAKRKKDNDEALLRLKDILFVEKKNLQEIDKLLDKVQNIDFWIDGYYEGNLLYQAIKLEDLNASKILLEKGASTVGMMHFALSDNVNIDFFQLILIDFLKEKNYKNINMLLINAIDQDSSDEKIKIILNHMSKVKKEYIYVVETAIKSCRNSKLIKLLLSKDKKLQHNAKLFSVLHKNSYTCPNKKDIAKLYRLKNDTNEIIEKPLSHKFIRLKK